jgi:hypothetical protein
MDAIVDRFSGRRPFPSARREMVLIIGAPRLRGGTAAPRSQKSGERRTPNRGPPGRYGGGPYSQKSNSKIFRGINIPDDMIGFHVNRKYLFRMRLMMRLNPHVARNIQNLLAIGRVKNHRITPLVAEE